ncbi:uncharacterized protein BO95DRAFT_159568 [Aspergillus brunneoviolaceus CBS 621.78]|uniref:Uncharacterized protein n=1 Tax=Aspergillus brunneoviolaceus CBS 621.78 TaxID=1450534 RepID=A0ACD1GNJ4_9EURO|nr:hypothetical protein BO95DRAFT_159568 [Aspergillus brunneoviolaceus CBS 621.78]RAH50689.1 hypothetical protein BO95DRAFT_159568 [Aspergillus brunneoviolaceus CBS 621.78]
MTMSVSSTPKIKRVEFAESLTSSPHRSYTNATTSNNVTEGTPHPDTKDSAIVKDMTYCASDLLYALHERTVDHILSDEVSQHSSRFDDYSQTSVHNHTPDYSRSPDWSHGTQRQSPTTRQLSSPNWALGKRIIPYHGPDSDSGDDCTSESGSAVSSELGFESVAQSRPESKFKSNAELHSSEQHPLHADIESIDLLKSPSPSVSPEPGSYSTAREHTGSQDAYDDTSEFEFDSEWEEDYDQFPSVSRPQVRELGFALCTSDFMRKGIYPVKRSEKRAFVDYASQKAVEIGMTEDEFERMMRALRGVYLLQWGENKGNDSKVNPESGSKPDSDRGPERGSVSPKHPSAVTSENQQAASGRKSVESLPDANLADDQGEDVIAGTKQDEPKPKDMEASVSESLQRLDFASADESGKGSATSLDKAGPASPNGKIMATPIDVDLAVASPATSKSPKMGTEQIDQKEQPSGKGLEEKSTKKLKMPVDDSSYGGRKRKQGESPLPSKDQPGNASHSEKSKRRKKTRSSSEDHTSLDRASTPSVQLDRDVQPQKKQSEKAAKEKATSPGKTKSLQSKKAYKLADDGIECVGQLTAEPQRNPRMVGTTQQLKKTIIPANSWQLTNASESVIPEKSTNQQPIQIARSSNSNQSSGTHKAGGSKVTARPAQARESEKRGNLKKVGLTKGHSNNHDTAELIDLTKPENGKHANKAKDPNFHKPGTPAMTKGSDLAELEGQISDIQAQIRHQGLLKAKQAETRRANPNKSPRLLKNGKAKGRPAKKSTRAEHLDFSTPMNRKVQPPAMRYGPYSSV